ncbi:probable auxin efflux carrier component 9 [Hordeum vulgare subsp. vulgare]|uniref:Auxin efflux carrier component n=1 Tax=Hordeum vulgare subsp. vulgare TaxID=112509 RepID=A0A8I6YIM6_HORVV|nr:probable auxin efflux carrier component 9 [Hordeum vulgare subsp. vulgare]
MITGSGVYHVVEAMAPLYTAAALGYASVRWLKAFSEEQCAGINRFVATFAMPALIFDLVSTNDPYAMNGRLVAADTLQKGVMLFVLVAWAAWSSARRRQTSAGKVAASPLRWVVTAFSVAQLPSTIIMGVPLLGGLYGPTSKDLLKQIVVMQLCVWYNVVVVMYEYMAAMDGSSMVGPAPVSPENVENTVVAPAQQGMAVGSQTTSTAVVGEVSPIHAADVEDAVAVDDVPLPAPPSMSHVVFVAGKKVLKIPNTYATFLGLVWALIAFKCKIQMPKIIVDSLFIIHTTTVGLSMFSSGTFMARQQQFVPCGYAIAAVSMILKFLIGPMAMLLASFAVGIHGILLRIAVIQAALPLNVISFVYAEKYKVHAEIMSTGVILGIFIGFPITVVYYILLEL